jgi:hypothetical protein
MFKYELYQKIKYHLKKNTERGLLIGKFSKVGTKKRFSKH